MFLRIGELRKDSERLDWLFANPVEALDIIGRHRQDEARFVRQTIDDAMKGEDDEQR